MKKRPGVSAAPVVVAALLVLLLCQWRGTSADGAPRDRAGSEHPAVVHISAGTPSARSVRDAPLADPFTSHAMRAYLAGREGDITAAVYDVATDATYSYRPGIAEQTASIIKVDILATLLWQAQTTPRQLTEDEQELATGMIEDSDNDDATALWNEVGGSQALSHFDNLVGLTDTAPNAAGYWGETTTTAVDQVELMKHVALSNSVLDSASRAYELGLMENVVGYEHWGVSNGPPTCATVALKNGWLPLAAGDWQINSIGYIDGDGRQYIIAVLTSGNPTEDYGIGTTEGISAIVWSHLGR